MRVLETGHLHSEVSLLGIDPGAARERYVDVLLILLARLVLAPRRDVLQYVRDPGEAVELIDARELDELRRADVPVRGREVQEELRAHRLGQRAVGEVFREPAARLQGMERAEAEQQQEQIADQKCLARDELR